MTSFGIVTVVMLSIVDGFNVAVFARVILARLCGGAKPLAVSSTCPLSATSEYKNTNSIQINSKPSVQGVLLLWIAGVL